MRRHFRSLALSLLVVTGIPSGLLLAQSTRELVTFDDVPIQYVAGTYASGSATVVGGTVTRWVNWPLNPTNIYWSAAAQGPSNAVCSGCLQQIRISFSRSVNDVQLRLTNGVPLATQFRFVSDRNEMIDVVLGPFQEYAADDSAFSRVITLPWTNVSQITIVTPVQIFAGVPYWNFAVDDLEFTPKPRIRQRLVVTDLTRPQAPVVETDIVSWDVPRFRLPIGSHFSLRHEKEIRPGEWEAVESDFVLGTPRLRDGIAEHALYPKSVLIPLGQGGPSTEVEFESVHRGEVLISAAPRASGLDSAQANVTIERPLRFGEPGNSAPQNTPNEFAWDARTTEMAHAYGVPPQVIKSIIFNETLPKWNATTWRYEPGYNLLYVNPKITTAPRSEYRLATRPHEGGLQDGANLCRGSSGLSSAGCLFPPDVDDVSARSILDRRVNCGATAPITDQDTFVTAREIIEGSPRQNFPIASICRTATGGSSRQRPVARPDPYDFTAQTPLASSYGLMQVLWDSALYHHWKGINGRLNPGLLFDTPDNIDRGAGSMDAGSLTLAVKFRRLFPKFDHASPAYASKAEFDDARWKMVRAYNGDNAASITYANDVTSFLPHFLPVNQRSRMIQNEECAALALTAANPSLRAAAGDRIFLGVQITSGFPLVYRWYLGSPGDRSRPLGETREPVLPFTPSGSESVWVEAANGCGDAATTQFSISERSCTTPTFATEPTSQQAPSGDRVRLTAEALGNPLEYAWYEVVENQPGSVPAPVPGQSNTLEVTVGPEARSYIAVAHNECGVAVSAPATVRMCAGPTITAEPLDTIVTPGTAAALAVSASSEAGSFSAQWFEGEHDPAAPIEGATSTQLIVRPDSTTFYSVRIEDSCGIAWSRKARVAVSCEAPSISDQPRSGSIGEGESYTLSVVATGTDPVSYRWFDAHTGVTLAETQTPSLAVSPAATTSYRVEVTNACGQVASSAATVTVSEECDAPGIELHPESAMIVSGQTHTLTVAATGAQPLTHQWYSREPGSSAWMSIAGATQASLTVSPSASTEYYARVSNGCGSAESAVARIDPLMSCAVVQIGQQPESGSVVSGSSVVLRVLASGSGLLTYQWYVGLSGDTSRPIQGATNDSVAVSPTSTTSYWVRVANSCSHAASVTATILVVSSCEAPWITQQPLGASARAGTVVTLSVSASGTGPLAYQWFIGDSGDTSRSIANAIEPLYEASPDETTSYWVQITNPCGVSNSARATITVVSSDTSCPAPAILAQPESATLIQGEAAHLVVEATAIDPISYQWYSGPVGDTATPVAGATSPTVTVSPTTTTSYWVRITTRCGSADSAAATITVQSCLVPSIVTQPEPKTIYAGGSATISVGAEGTGPLSYQWYRGIDSTDPIEGATSSTVTVSPSTTTPYWVMVTNECGSTASDVELVTVLAVCEGCGIDDKPPLTPEYISTRTADTGTLSMEWSDVTDDGQLVEFTVWQWDGERYMPAVTTNRRSSSHRGLPPGQQVRFIVVATDAAANAAPSSSITTAVR